MSMRGGGHRVASKQAARVMLFERRLLMGCTCAVLFGLLLWVISISTEYWFAVTCPTAAAVNNTFHKTIGPGYMLSSHSGLWRTCRTVYVSPPETETSDPLDAPLAAVFNQTEAENRTSGPEEAAADQNVTQYRTEQPVDWDELGDSVTSCRYLRFKLLDNYSDEHPYNVVIGYRRTCLGFCCISMLMLALSIFFSAYTFRMNRYTFKRVAACLHFIVAGVQLVVIEVQVTSLHYQELRLRSVFPSGCHWNYSASFVLGWICFIINLFSGLGFLYTSAKKKKAQEGNAEPGADVDDMFDDEPQIMGR